MIRLQTTTARRVAAQSGAARMTEAEFIDVMAKSFGYAVMPMPGDLERANCPDAGKQMHMQCSVCEPHGLPMLYCITCTRKRLGIGEADDGR